MAAPLKISLTYTALAVAPAGPTQRWTYTVPAGRFAIVELLDLNITRDQVAAPVGHATCYVIYTPSGGAAVNILVARNAKNTVGDQAGKTFSGELRLAAGDKLQGATADASTGGSHAYDNAIVATEYDA